jgi:hypothetical protein
MDMYTVRPRRPHPVDHFALDHALSEVKKNPKSKRDLDPRMLERVIEAIERLRVAGKTHEEALLSAIEEEKVHAAWQGLYKMGAGYYYGHRSRGSARGRRKHVPQPGPQIERVERIDPNGQYNLL